MDFDISWLLLSLPVAFVLGWLASRLDLRQLRIENRRAPKAYFRGLNFLLNEQQDQAIDAFIEAVQNDPDTSELHFALGNLFRRRGEYERAVRVHQHLLSRGDLSSADRHRAQHALALDYLRAGLLDRAEEALLKLEGTSFEPEAQLALLANYERSRDWVHAADVAQRLDDADHGTFCARLAHYLCEQSAAQLAAHAPDTAQHLLEQAIRKANDSDLGLTSSVWTRDLAKGKAISARLETGVTAINDHLYTHGLSETPWGGWKLSGIGRTHGAHGLQEMTHAKVVNWDILPAKRNLWWFPFSQDTYTALLAALRFAFPRSPGEYLGSSLKLTPYLLKKMFTSWK